MTAGGGRRSLWRHADFMKLWTAESVSQLGSQVSMLALPLIAISILRASPFEVGLLTTVEFAPFVLVGLPAGVWVDRLRRRPVLICGDLGRALALSSIPAAYALDALTIGQLYLVAFTTGVLTVFFDVAYQSYLPALVEAEELIEGNAKLEISRSGAQIAGPGLAGVLIDLVTAPVAVLADAISFLASATGIFLIRRHEPAPERAAGAARRGAMRREMSEGLRYVLGHRLLRPIAATTATANLFNAAMFAVLVLWMVRELHLRPAAIGLVFAAGNVGWLVGAVASGRLAGWIGLGRAIVLPEAVGGLGAVLVPLTPRPLAIPLLIVAQFVMSFGSTAYNINQVSLRQAITPARLHGRMNATMRFMVWGTLPVGSLIGGILGGTIGLRPTLWVGALGGLLSFLPAALSPVRSLASIEAAMPAAEPA
ncbi:MAG TPA: MFS transporter [Actinomycetes bacterium]|jgi:MFS family permease|nr:MFS transporter [Actinomycetes bacterium]